MNDTIDTLKIKAEGDSESAVKSLDKVISTLERIKGVTQSRSLTTLTTHLSSLSSVVSNIKTNHLSKLTEVTSALSNIKDFNMSASLPFRMRELIDSLKGIGDVDVSKVERVSDALSSLSKARDVKVPEVVSNERAEELKRYTQEIKKSTNSTDKFGKTVKEAFSDSIVGKFGQKIHDTVQKIGRIALYRIMRTMIRQVTDAFKTGIDNMYQYSKTFNGEYARSMDQIASANLTFKNSIGAIMAPIINLVAPWLDKIVDKLLDINNTIAMVIAGLSGKSTYSKAVRVTTEYAKAANQASDNTEKVTEKVEELKRSLAGLDEITIIGYKETSPLTAAGSVADNADTGLDYGSMFVETPVDMAKVNEIKEKLEDILEIAKWIGIAIAAWELVKFISSIAEAITGIGLLKSQMIGITLMITGFALEFSGGYHIGYGDAKLLDYIKLALGSALGIAGSLLVFGINSLGWTIGITAAVAIGIASIYVGMEARLSDVVEQAFYDAGGTITISDLADQFERYCQAVINANQPTIDLGTEIQSTIDNTIRPAANDIRTLGHAVALSGKDTDNYMPRIIEQIKNLDSGTHTVLNDVYDNIVRAVSGSLFDSLSNAGIYVPELLNTLARVKGETTKTVDEAIKEMQSLSIEFQNGSISGEEYHTKLETLTSQIESLTGATDPAKTALEKAKLAVEGVDWQNKTARDSAFSKIAESALGARDSINDAYVALESSIAIAKTWSDDPEYQLYLNEILKAKQTEREQQLSDLNTYMDGFMGDLQDDLISKMGSVAEDINAEYQDNWWAQIFTTEDQFVSKGLNKYKTDTIDPITDKMKDLYAELGFNGQFFASEAASKTVSGLYTFAGTGRAKSTGRSMEDAVKDAYTNIGRNVPDGLSKGLKENADAPVKATQDLVEKMQDSITGSQAWNMHSPSKKAEKYGENIDLGWANGIDRKKNIVVSALENILNTMLNRLETFTNRWRLSINTMLDDMAYAWGNADFRSDGSYSYKYLAQRSIQRFAQGGFPEDGFFYANHNELVGQFTNGRTAVANNEQIVEGIAGGVASANEEQNALLREQNRLLRLLYEKDSSIDVGTIRAAFSRENKRNGKVGVPVSV